MTEMPTYCQAEWLRRALANEFRMRHIVPANDADVVSGLRVELSRRGYERTVPSANRNGITGLIASTATNVQDVEMWRHAHDGLAARIWIVSGPDASRAGALLAGDISVYPDTREVEAAGAAVHLTPTEFEFLRLLVEAGGRIVPVFRFFSVTRKLRAGMPKNGISVHMCFLRKKLATAHAMAHVKTVRAIGFRLVY